MNKYYVLIENIKKSNLSEENKQTLIDILSQDIVDINAFILAFLRILQLATTVSKLFGIDIGDNLN
jgi:tRNA threonylcarbamoyladenosine modification (KEOPS) complex  Pcc1 subunit